jgi:hypothetical protein
MFKIEFLKSSTINSVTFKKGDVLNVSRSIRDAKVASKEAKDFVEKPKKK